MLVRPIADGGSFYLETCLTIIVAIPFGGSSGAEIAL